MAEPEPDAARDGDRIAEAELPEELPTPEPDETAANGLAGAELRENLPEPEPAESSKEKPKEASGEVVSISRSGESGTL